VTDHQGSLGVAEIDVTAAGQPGNRHCPGATGIDVLFGDNAQAAAADGITAEGRSDLAIDNDKALDFGVGPVETAAELPGMGDVGQSQPKWVNGCIGNGEGTYQMLGEQRFEFARFSR
jgi:hypothetical protein